MWNNRKWLVGLMMVCWVLSLAVASCDAKPKSVPADPDQWCLVRLIAVKFDTDPVKKLGTGTPLPGCLFNFFDEERKIDRKRTTNASGSEEIQLRAGRKYKLTVSGPNGEKYEKEIAVGEIFDNGVIILRFFPKSTKFVFDKYSDSRDFCQLAISIKNTAKYQNLTLDLIRTDVEPNVSFIDNEPITKDSFVLNLSRPASYAIRVYKDRGIPSADGKAPLVYKTQIALHEGEGRKTVQIELTATETIRVLSSDGQM